MYRKLLKKAVFFDILYNCNIMQSLSQVCLRAKRITLRQQKISRFNKRHLFPLRSGINN